MCSPTPDECVRGYTNSVLTAQYFAGKIWVDKKNLDLDAKSLDLLELSVKISACLALNL
jgi:hypothetical protein